ncbi:ribonuclease III [Gammaproteobacteria bacterium]|nr:ribonuclease III [Gammaproteobacteria bacterium]
MRSISQKLGYIFRDPSLLDLSLTHKSSSSVNNERLEYLGDSLLNFIIADEVFKRFENLPEGSLTQFRASLVSRELLNEMGKEIGLEECVKIGKGETVKGNSILGNTFEALIGAIYLDGGFLEASKIVSSLFNDRLNALSDSQDLKDSKSRLQEHLQKRGDELPCYELVNEENNNQVKKFTIVCYLKGLGLSAEAEGSTRKKAEIKAAERMLGLIELKND